MVLIWQVAYITFRMTTIWNASGIFTMRKPLFFLTDTLDNIDYFISLWLCCHSVQQFQISMLIELSLTIYADLKLLLQLFWYFINMNDSINYNNKIICTLILSLQEKNNSLAIVSLLEKDQLEADCLLSPLNICILFQIEQRQGNNMQRAFYMAWQIVTEIILSYENSVLTEF